MIDTRRACGCGRPAGGKGSSAADVRRLYLFLFSGTALRSSARKRRIEKPPRYRTHAPINRLHAHGAKETRPRSYRTSSDAGLYASRSTNIIGTMALGRNYDYHNCIENAGLCIAWIDSSWTFSDGAFSLPNDIGQRRHEFRAAVSFRDSLFPTFTLLPSNFLS